MQLRVFTAHCLSSRHKAKCYLSSYRTTLHLSFSWEFSPLNKDTPSSGRRWDDLHSLEWCICTLSGLWAFSLKGTKEASVCSRCWQLGSNSSVLLCSIAWSPSPFLGRPFDLRFLVNNAVCNVICTTVYGKRFNYGDETFKKLLHLFEEFLKEDTGFLTQVNQKHKTFCKLLPSVAWEHCDFIIFLFASHNIFSVSLVLTSQLLNMVPILLHIPGLLQKVFRGQKEFMDFTDMLVHKHMETWNPAYTRDFTDEFLKEMKKVGWHQQNLSVQGQFLCLIKLVDRSLLPHKAV